MKRKISAFVITLLVFTGIMYSSSPTGLAAITIGGGFGYGYGYGSGTFNPVVKCKWEQQPVDVTPYMEDGDPEHLKDGFQILPPLEAGATKTICYYAVVTDEEDMGNVAQVFADVYHPTGSPEPYGPSKTGGIQKLPYFKYEIPFSYNCTGDEAEAIVTAAYDAGLITFNEPDYDVYDVLHELDKGTAALWMGCAEIDYEQPAGLYGVYVYAIGTNDDFSEPLWNQFEYVPACGIEVDFTEIDFGSINLGVEKMIPGDTIWDNPAGINHATVRNIGNTWAHVTVEFDDMGFGHDSNENWNVQYDARMGSDNTYYEGNIMPYEERMLDNALGLSKKDELDFSIKILKGTGEHFGTITLECEVEPFSDPVPEYIVGTGATGDY